MSEKMYHLSIEIKNDKPETEYLASAYGNLRVVTFVARDAIKAMTGDQYAVALVEVDGTLGDEKRTIVDTTGDAEICAYVLNKRLRAEKTAAE
jgi:hypothetical protein